MKKIGSLGNFSSKVKSRIKTAIYVAVSVLIYIWALLSGMQTWVSSLILDNNRNMVIADILNNSVVEVAEVYANGDFRLVGEEELHTEDEISEYIRVPSGMKPYYQPENRLFVAPITISDGKQIGLKFYLLDVLCYIMLILNLYAVMKDGKLWQKIAMWVLFGVSVLFAQCAIDITFLVLYNIGDEIDWLLIIKIIIPVLIFVIRAQVLKKKAISSEKSKKKSKKSL